MNDALLAVYAVLAREGRFVMAPSHHSKFDLRGITQLSIVTALLSPDAEIIEDYLSDPRSPATLVLGHVAGRALHLVLTAPADDAFLVVTAYWPDERPRRWSHDYRRRMP